MTGPLSDQHLDEIAELLARLDAVPSMGHLDSADLGWVRPVLHDLLAEIRRLRGENEQLSDLDAAATRRAELQAERDRAVTRWHEEHQRAEQAVAERNAIARQIADRTDERDRLHDALSEVLATGSPGFDGEVLRGLRRTLWITPERLQGWRDVLAATERSERDGTGP